MKKKVCNKCKLEKELSEFSLQVNACKSCKMHYWRERQKLLRARDKSDIDTSCLRTCITCKCKKSGSEFYIDLSKPSGFRSDCCKCYNKKLEIKKRKNPKTRAIRNLSGRYREICRSNNLRKNETTIQSLGCSGKFFANHIEKQFKPGMTWENYGKWHIDHIKPWASIDINDIEQVKKCRHYTNLQPLWWWENLSKGAKYDNQS